MASSPAPQALVLKPGSVSASLVDPLLPSDQSWRVEFEIRNWTVPSPGNYQATVFFLKGVGAWSTIWPDGRLALTDFRDTTASASPCFLSLAQRTDVLVRFQRDVSSRLVSCEMWNSDGSGYQSQQDTIVAPVRTWDGMGGILGSADTDVALDYIHVSTAVLPKGSTAPRENDLTNWTVLNLDGVLTDSGGNGHDVVFPGAIYKPKLVGTVSAPRPQSLILRPGRISTSVTDPTMPSSQSWRVEFEILDWTLPPAGVYDATIFYLQGTGAWVAIFPDGRLALLDVRDQPASRSPCFVNLVGRSDALVRFQRDSVHSQITCEIWNADGTSYEGHVDAIQSTNSRWDGQGGSLGSANTSTALAFLRVSTTVVPMAGKPPTQGDQGDWTQLNFDGNALDTSGNHHDIILPSPVFEATPARPPTAMIRTAGAPQWSSWVSLRAGYPNQIDGSQSFSAAGLSLRYQWEQLDGPSQVTWSSQSVAQPYVEGLVFGTYTFRLQVTDTNGTTGAAEIQVGAVAMDDNGVVIHADPNVERIFGPMIAFGKNPWGYMDERAMAATRLRSAAYRAQGLDRPTWSVPQAGVVSYIFNGADHSGSGGTALCAPISSPTATTVTLCDAGRLDFSTLPTRILVGPAWQRREEIRICAITGNIATVCYDGRGSNPGSSPDTYRTAAQAWPESTAVGQIKVSGMGTAFLSTICPAGAGPTGAVKYADGSVTVHRGSSSIVGNGTAWSASNGVVASYMIRVAATHGGQPFVFHGYIVSVDGSAGITVSRPYPFDADDGAFPYQILAADIRQPVLNYTRSDHSNARIALASSGCESDTTLYGYAPRYVAGVNGTLQIGKQYSYAELPGYAGPYGVNFYGEDLAHRALYLRSGWKPALDAANEMSDQYVTSPYLAGGDAGGIPLLYGGGVVGGIAAAVIDHRVQWSDLRGFIRTGSDAVKTECDAADTRDSSYSLMFLALGAVFDPDASERAKWAAALQEGYTRDERCRNSSADSLLNNSWANAFLFNSSQFPPLIATDGSAVLKGNELPPDMCLGRATGILTVTAGSAQVSGAGFVAGKKIVITGSRVGQPFVAFFEFALSSPNVITLSGVWLGDSGTASYVIDDGTDVSAVGTGASDPRLSSNWTCTWNNPTSITLNKPWIKPGGGTEKVYLFRYNLSGRGQQPYMVGMKALQMRLASLVSDVTLSSNYTRLAVAASQWLRDNGFDPVTKGLYYGRIYGACEPVAAPPDSPAFMSRNVGCNQGLNPNGVRAARVLTAEATNALSVLYQYSPTPENRTWADTAYGSIWGYPPYTAPGFFADGSYVRDENSDSQLAAYKWTGFFFGMGMSHQWPAVRLGGVKPAIPTVVPVTTRVANYPGATAAVKVTAPSGAKGSTPCDKTTCLVTLDKRQGAHWVQIDYVSSANVVVASDPPRLVQMN